MGEKKKGNLEEFLSNLCQGLERRILDYLDLRTHDVGVNFLLGMHLSESSISKRLYIVFLTIIFCLGLLLDCNSAQKLLLLS